MTRRGWPPAELPGLRVDLGRRGSCGEGWVRAPVAVWRCRHGCTHHAAADAPVADLLAELETTGARALHSSDCPLHEGTDHGRPPRPRTHAP